MREKTLKFWVYAIAGAVSLVIAGLFILVIVQIAQIKSLKKTETQLKQKLNEILESEQNYDDANRYVQSDEFIESYAREVLGFGKEDEENYN